MVKHITDPMLLTVLLAIARIEVMVRPDSAVDEARRAVHLDLDIPWLIRETTVIAQARYGTPVKASAGKGHIQSKDESRM